MRKLAEVAQLQRVVLTYGKPWLSSHGGLYGIYFYPWIKLYCVQDCIVPSYLLEI